VKPEYSIVVPIHNEAESIVPLYTRLKEVMEGHYPSFEIIYIDDSSTDGSARLLEELAAVDPRVTVIELRRNFGQTPALAAGFDAAQGEIIVSLDGDQQHDPADIPALIEKLREGYDIASGWRYPRVDNYLTRRLPSAIANAMMSKVSGVKLHDFGTTFKAYRRETIQGVNLYGELHRFIPALASLDGARIAEVPIRNVVRPEGKSHYGLSRTYRVMLDLVTIRFLLRYLTRPLHFFGSAGLALLSAGSAILLYNLIEKLRGIDILEAHGPLLVLGSIAFLAGVQLVSTGLIGEILVRTYFESQDRRIYSVKRVISQARK
jgi:glycosyltransferase involved in cell wall biosynthesis